MTNEIVLATPGEIFSNRPIIAYDTLNEAGKITGTDPEELKKRIMLFGFLRATGYTLVQDPPRQDGIIETVKKAPAGETYKFNANGGIMTLSDNEGDMFVRPYLAVNDFMDFLRKLGYGSSCHVGTMIGHMIYADNSLQDTYDTLQFYSTAVEEMLEQLKEAGADASVLFQMAPETGGVKIGRRIFIPGDISQKIIQIPDFSITGFPQLPM